MIGKISTKKYFSKIVTILVVTSFFNAIIPLSYAQTMNDQEVGEMRIRIVRCFNEPQISNATPVPTIPRLDSLMSDCIGFNVMDFLSRSQTLHNFYRAARDAYYRGRGGNGGGGGDTPPDGNNTGDGLNASDTTGAGGECSLSTKIKYEVHEVPGYDIGDDLVLPAVQQTGAGKVLGEDPTIKMSPSQARTLAQQIFGGLSDSVKEYILPILGVPEGKSLSDVGDDVIKGFLELFGYSYGEETVGSGGSSGGAGASRSFDYDASGYTSPKGIPVNEVGPLLLVGSNSRELLQQICKTSRSIDNTTKSIKIDTTAIKIDVAEIARIQKRFEEKTFVTDPAIRKLARENLKKTEEEVKKIIETGRVSEYTSNQENDSYIPVTSYIPTPKAYIDEQVRIAAALFLKDLDEIESDKLDTKVKNALKDTMRDSIIQNLDDRMRLQSKLISPKFDDLKLETDQKKNPWVKFDYMTQKNNNIFGLYSIALEEFQTRIQRAEENAREELLAGGGFIPQKECLGKPVTTPLGDVCPAYKNVTAGQTIKDTVSTLHTAEIQQAITAGGFGDKVDAEKVTETSTKTFKQDKEKAETKKEETPPAPKSNPPSANNNTPIPLALSNPQKDNSINTNKSQLASIVSYVLGNDQKNSPEIEIDKKPITINGQTIGTTIYWDIKEGVSCQADNQWITFGNKDKPSYLITGITGSKETKGSMEIYHPAIFRANVTATSETPVNSPQSLQTVVSINKNNIQQKTIYTPNTFNLEHGYFINLTIDKEPVSIKIQNPTQKEIVQELAKILSQNPSMKDFQFIADETSLSIIKTKSSYDIIPNEATYGIKCFDDQNKEYKNNIKVVF